MGNTTIFGHFGSCDRPSMIFSELLKQILVWGMWFWNGKREVWDSFGFGGNLEGFVFAWCRNIEGFVAWFRFEVASKRLTDCS